MTSSHEYSVSTPSRVVATTDTARPWWCRILVALVLMWTLVPAASTFSWHTSHIWPGPYFGYSNSSMRLVMSVALRLARIGIFLESSSMTAFMPALRSERFLIRCAAQSAWSLLAGTPHTFSLYVLKKCR